MAYQTSNSNKRAPSTVASSQPLKSKCGNCIKKLFLVHKVDERQFDPFLLTADSSSLGKDNQKYKMSITIGHIP
jgi:hypothetical protein